MNIFVVEDEPPILREILSIIESFHEDYCLLGSAVNGKDALQFLEKHGAKIDVLITDIQIPVLTGLELISHIRDSYPHILCIILTGYSDFNYARQALRYGVFDYLLKPVDEEELHGKLREAYARKCQDYIKDQTAPIPSSPQPLKETPALKETTSLKTISPDPAFDHDGLYQVALLSLGPFPLYSSKYHNLFPDFWKKIQLEELFCHDPSLKDRYWIIDSSSPSEKILLFLLPEEQLQRRDTFLADLMAPLLNGPEQITIAIEPQFPGIRKIHSTVLRLRSQINRCVRIQKSQLLFLREADGEASEFAQARSWCLRLSQLFAKKNVPVFEAELKNCIRKIQKADLPSAELFRFLKELFLYCIRAVEDICSFPSLDIDSTAGEILVFSDSYVAFYENTRSIFRSLFELMLDQEPLFHDKADIVMKLDSYMKEHFTSSINTQSIAKEFGFTPAYLSKIFREYKNVSPSDYITDLRIERAKEILLANPSCKIKDIALSVGYNDPLYFSKVFKNLTGVSPKQYAEQPNQ